MKAGVGIQLPSMHVFYDFLQFLKKLVKCGQIEHVFTLCIGIEGSKAGLAAEPADR